MPPPDPTTLQPGRRPHWPCTEAGSGDPQGSGHQAGTGPSCQAGGWGGDGWHQAGGGGNGWHWARVPGGRGGPRAAQPSGDGPPHLHLLPCSSPPGRDLPVGTAHFSCLTSAASSGKLSVAVCKHPFPLCRTACQAPPADSLAGSRLAQAARPGTRLLAGGRGGLSAAVRWVLRPRDGAAAPLRPPASIQSSVRGPEAPQAGEDRHPKAWRCRGRNSRTLGRQEVWEKRRSPRREHVSPRLGGQATSRGQPVPTPESPSFLRHGCQHLPCWG